MSGPQKQMVSKSARLAQDRCYAHIYRDANAYAQCLRDLVRPEPTGSFRRLGIEYFGFVGSLAYARVSQQGSDAFASEFLRKFRVTQKHLLVSDEELCASVPGNCVTRIAQARQIELTPSKPQAMRVQCIGPNCRLIPAE